MPAALPETRRALVAGEVVGGEGRYGSHAWLGLPFAAPPVGALRWSPPQCAAPWEGQRAALRFPSPCAQVASPLGNAEGVAPGELLGSEDCLYLSVWAPRVSLDALASGGVRLPVMVWIHGGGNSMGATNFYEGGRLASSENVVVVSVQYRLGPFGWLRHQSLRAGAEDEAERSGNFGTLDLVAALEWVKANVAAFGGDPDNVTVFGESAGGLNVYSLLVSPRARGLFHRAIAQSGGLSRTTLEQAEGFADQSPPGHLSSSNEAMSRLWKATGADGPAAAMRASGAQEVFVYRFDWRGEPTRAGVDLGKLIGAAHADARLPARADKCRLLRELASWSHGASARELAAAGAQGCLETPPAPAPREAR